MYLNCGLSFITADIGEMLVFCHSLNLSNQPWLTLLRRLIKVKSPKWGLILFAAQVCERDIVQDYETATLLTFTFRCSNILISVASFAIFGKKKEISKINNLTAQMPTIF